MPNDIERQWLAAWRFAGPELERIRNEELRALSDDAGLSLLGAGIRSPEQSGLIAFQAWMMRMRVRELLKERSIHPP